ncbi:ABC transporter substrate-binding protein [Devosia psychrophila]|jgi:lactose/L-arabinose transport system substrate-binding protein|uniref:ABC transporter substrate-binding protein n=1 Tax=Devosia psychrophila TaxID=728005 RepID=A0A0F5PVW0_9HYPH|nr:extracellular solute-binding protein [Devosia psychrophila]KKC31969.1 ABC transporter substrate-binding protein [Devosia psychrophila]SFC74451.1 lactose/L-arabinose transport system substrate-binding protein [Devosia psychrophila]
MNRIISRRGRMFGIAMASVSFLSVAAVSAGEISVWVWDANFNGAAMREAGSRYTALKPDATVVVDDTASQDDIRAKLQTQLLAGSTDGLPDIVLIQDDVAQKYLQSFPGAFEPLSDSIDMSAFAEYKVAAATLDGKSYSLPFDSGVTGLFYRSDYIKEAGFTAEDLNNITWDRLVEIGTVVKEKTGHQLLDLDLNDSGLIRMMMQQAGTWYFNEDGSLNIIGNAPLKKALETYAKFYQADLVKPVSGWAEYTGAFTSGEVATVPVGVWITATIKANADQSGLWAVAPIPRLDIEGSVNASNQGGSSWYVLASSDNKAEAVDFLKTVWAGDIDFYQKILVNQGAVGSLLAAREGEAYKATDEFFGGAPVWQDFSTWLSQIPSVGYGVFTAEVDAALQAQLPTIIQGGDLDAALQAINDQATQQMQ